jgi:hypothetical protein
MPRGHYVHVVIGEAHKLKLVIIIFIFVGSRFSKFYYFVYYIYFIPFVDGWCGDGDT